MFSQIHEAFINGKKFTINYLPKIFPSVGHGDTNTNYIDFNCGISSEGLTSAPDNCEDGVTCKYLNKDIKIGEDEFKIGTELNETIISKFVENYQRSEQSSR